MDRRINLVVLHFVSCDHRPRRPTSAMHRTTTATGAVIAIYAIAPGIMGHFAVFATTVCGHVDRLGGERRADKRLGFLPTRLSNSALSRVIRRPDRVEGWCNEKTIYSTRRV